MLRFEFLKRQDIHLPLKLTEGYLCLQLVSMARSRRNKICLIVRLSRDGSIKFVKTARRNFPEDRQRGPKTFCTGYKTKLFDRTWSNIDKPESKSKVPAQLFSKSNNKHHCALAPQGLRVHAENLSRRIWGILTFGDCVQMSVSSFGTAFVKQSMPEMVIFPVKTAPILYLWCWILGG